MSTHPKDCCEWESNNAELQLEGTGLAEEFPYGCDTLEHVGNALIACRKQRDDLKAQFPMPDDYRGYSNIQDIMNVQFELATDSLVDKMGLDLYAPPSTIKKPSKWRAMVRGVFWKISEWFANLARLI